MGEEILEIVSDKTFDTEAEANAYAIELGKRAIDYYVEKGEWPLWAQGGLRERRS